MATDRTFLRTEKIRYLCATYKTFLRNDKTLGYRAALPTKRFYGTKTIIVPEGHLVGSKVNTGGIAFRRNALWTDGYIA